MNEHSCIKCGVKYSDSDEDAYYCEGCLVEKNRIAAEVQAKMDKLPRAREMTSLQRYDNAPKLRGFVRWDQI